TAAPAWQGATGHGGSVGVALGWGPPPTTDMPSRPGPQSPPRRSSSSLAGPHAPPREPLVFAGPRPAADAERARPLRRWTMPSPRPFALLAACLALPAAEPAWGQAPGKGGAARVDFLGDPLPDGAVARMGPARFRHGARVTGLAFLPDGRSLI